LPRWPRADRPWPGDDPGRRAVRHRQCRPEELGQPHRAQAGAVPAAQPAPRGAYRGLHRQHRRAEDNLKLSRDRAQSVADMLVDLGIDEKRMQVEGYGDQYPVEANASSGAGRRTAGWRSCSPTTRASSRQRAESCPQGRHAALLCRPRSFRSSCHAVVLSTMLQSVPVHFATVTVSSTVSESHKNNEPRAP
jgi:hypothetical protein